MCGLVGIITKLGNGFNKDQVDAFNDLLFIDSLRGMDSTGCFLVENDGTLSWNKEAVPSPEFCRKKEHQDMLKQGFLRGRALVGHNRAATRGVVNDENAHPFTVDDRITLVHNGTLYGDHRKLADVDVDSHAIAHVIHESGDDVEAAIQKINGAFALIWHDFQNNTLNFLRNNARPLHWVETTSGYLWASEANMLEWILSRYPNMKPAAEGIQLLTAGTLVRFDFSNHSWKLDTKELKLEAPKPAYTSYGSRGPYHSRHWADEDDCGFSFLGQQHDCAYDVPFVPKQTSTNVVQRVNQHTAVNTPRIIKEEMRIAKDLGLNMSGPTFAASSDTVKTDEWVVMECRDYNTVAHQSDASGYFLYGLLQTDPRYMVRVFVDQSVPEMEVLDMSLNHKDIMVKVTARSWRAFYNAFDGDGYGMIACNKWTHIPVLEEIKE